MALKIADRVKETSLTQGSGSLTLEGAFGGFQTFSATVGDGNTTYYVIENESKWEVGIGTYTSSSNTLSRDTVLKSSQSGDKINIYGVATVFCSYPADRAVIRQEDGLITESGLLTLTGGFNLSPDFTITRDSAGNFFHAYKDDAHDRTIGLYTDGNTSPEWRLGLKNSPSDKTDPPSFGYVYGKDGQVGLVGNSSNSITLGNSSEFSVKHNNLQVLRASSLTGIHLNANSSAYPAVTINGAAGQSQPLTEWADSAGNVLSIVDKDGKVGINKTSATYELDVDGSGRLDSILVSGIRFQDGTFQATAHSDVLTNQVSGWASTTIANGDNAVSGWADSTMDTRDAAVSGWAQAYVDSQDHSAAAVSGWVDGTFLTSSSVEFTYISGIAVYASGLAGTGGGDVTTEQLQYVSGIAVYASGQVDQNSSDIITVSGLLYDDSSISGYIDLQDAAVSGWAQAYVDSQDHSAAAVSGWAGSYADAGDAAVSGWADSTMTSRDNAVSGWAGSYADAGDAAVSGWAQAYVDSQDHSAAAVSGWAGSYADAGDAAVSGWADSTMTSRDNAVSGWADSTMDARDASVSGYFETRTDQNANDIVSVSGIAAYASGHNLQSITDNGSSTTNSISSSGNITATTGILDVLDLTLLGNGSQPSHSEGVVFYDSENHTLSLYNDEADVTLQLGQEEFLRVRNNSGGTIYNGSGVRITGAHGNAAPTVVPAIATTEEKSQIVGLATHDIENETFGYVTTYGVVRDVNTAAFSAGDELFLDASTSGNLTNVSPTIPNYKVTVGHVIRSHSNGSILVQIGHPKLGGGDLKSEAAVTASGVPFVTSVADTNAGGMQTTSNFVYDSGNQKLLINGNEVQVSGDNISNFVNNAGYLTSHPSISAASSSDNSGRTYIQDVLLDTNGHVTGIATATETVTDTTYTAGSGLELHGTEFQAAISGANLLATNTPTDNYVASYDAATGKFTWVANAGDGGATYTAGSGLVLDGDNKFHSTFASGNYLLGEIRDNSSSGVVISGIANTNSTNIATNVANIASNLVEVRANSASGVVISGIANEAYSWGDHSSAGYLTSETSHSDVLVDGDFGSQGIMKRGASAGNYSIITDNSSNWNTAYSWGDHSTQGYLTSDSDTTYTGDSGVLLQDTVFNANLVDYTVQTTAANSRTTTASRTYAIQVDSSDKLVVNVPWSDTDTTYSEATSSSEGLMSTAHHDKLDGIEASADVTDTTNVTAAGALMDSEVTNLAQVKAFDSSDYAPAAGSSSVVTVGTVTAGTWQGTAIADGYIASAATWNAKQAALTFGIANTNAVKIDAADVADDEYARFTANGLESRTIGEIKTDLSLAKGDVGLGNVENTALSTWAGTANITTVGTISNGTWQGTAIGSSYIADAFLKNDADDTTSGTVTMANLIIGDAGNIGSASDNDAVAIASDGEVTLSQRTTFSKAQKTPIKSNTDGATVTFDLDEANTHTVTLGGNRTLALSNADVGQKFIIRLTQDATGSRTVNWFSTIKWPGNLVPTLTTTASKTDVFGFICTGTNTYDGFVIGYNL